MSTANDFTFNEAKAAIVFYQTYINSLVEYAEGLRGRYNQALDELKNSNVGKYNELKGKTGLREKLINEVKSLTQSRVAACKTLGFEHMFKGDESGRYISIKLDKSKREKEGKSTNELETELQIEIHRQNSSWAQGAGRRSHQKRENRRR